MIIYNPVKETLSWPSWGKETGHENSVLAFLKALPFLMSREDSTFSRLGQPFLQFFFQNHSLRGQIYKIFSTSHKAELRIQQKMCFSYWKF